MRYKQLNKFAWTNLWIALYKVFTVIISYNLEMLQKPPSHAYFGHHSVVKKFSKHLQPFIFHHMMFKITHTRTCTHNIVDWGGRLEL